MDKTTFLKNPATLISLGLHAAVILYYAPPQKVNIVSGQPQAVRVSLKSFEAVKKPVEKQKVVQDKPTKTLEQPPLEQIASHDVPEQVQTALPNDFQNPHFSPTPSYPRQARLRGIEGQVKLKLGINGQGVPVIVDLLESSGHQALDMAALEGLKRWRFMATNNSDEISFWTEKVVQFQLN